MDNSLKVFEVPFEGISLVEASAGTGKTYNITSLYIRAILERDLMPDQILVLTFTEDATAELKNRLRQRLIDSINAFENGVNAGDSFLKELIQQEYPNALRRLRKALYSFDKASVFTIHGFCNRLLNEYSLQFGVDPYFKVLPDASQLLQDCVDDYWRKFIRKDHSLEDQFILEYLIEKDFGPDELQSILSEVINRPYAKLIPKDADLEQIKQHIPQFYAAFEEIKNVSKEELEELKEVLFHEGLSKIKYPVNKRDLLWEKLKNCFEAEIPETKFIEILTDFGTKLCTSLNKGHERPMLSICERIQHFCDIAEEFKALKPAFVLNSVNKITADFNQRKSDRNVYSYDDFLIKVNEGLQKDSSRQLAQKLAETYPIALVDEFQDTDPIQYSIFRQIYYHREQTALFMIGDPKQAIYGFRGADIYTYLKAKGDVEDSQSYSLNYNYRSNDKMIEAVNEVFTVSDSPFRLDDLKYKAAKFPSGKELYYLTRNGEEVPKPLQCILLETDDDKGGADEIVEQAVIQEIVELLNGNYRIGEEEVSQKDIAILVRSGKQGENIQQRLRAIGVKSVLKSNNSVFNTLEAQELMLLLQSVQKNFYEPGIRAVLATNLLGKSASQLIQLMENEAEWARTVEIFTRAKFVWENNGIEQALELLKQSFKISLNLARHIDAERRITNLNHISELLAKAEREQRLFGNNLLKWFNRKINDEKLKNDEDNLRLESDEDLIQISTIHASKGLEYPIVFCPFLWTPPFRITRNDTYRFFKDDQIYIDVNTGVERPENKNAHLNEELRESARLLYVALTRSSAACYIFLPDIKQVKDSALATVLDLDTTSQMEDALRGCLHVNVRPPVQHQELKLNSDKSKDYDFSAKPFQRKDVFDFPRMLSFSSLSQLEELEEVVAEYDEADFDEEDTEVDIPEYDELVMNRFTFPRGASAGTFLHKVFEDIDFTEADNLQHVIKQNLEYSGIPEDWENVTSDWVQEILDHTLQEPDLKLSGLKSKDVLKEMEFHFPAKNLQLQQLWKLIRGSDQPLNRSGVERLSGFMKGYIDLIFRSNGRYYILDYKSNHLGNQPDDYTSELLREKILSSRFDLQYNIYTLALHRYLKHLMPDYEYSKHFGGVFYLFLRGVSVEQAESGVYFDKPDEKVISMIDEYFKRGNST